MKTRLTTFSEGASLETVNYCHFFFLSEKQKLQTRDKISEAKGIVKDTLALLEMTEKVMNEDLENEGLDSAQRTAESGN